jgi:hypothetical protein
VQIRTNAAGSFALRLGFAPRHGVGTEVVGAVDLATNDRTPAIAVQVKPALIVVMGQLSASPNPVRDGGTTLVMGTGFRGDARLLVRWMRPDGTRTAIEVVTGHVGTFAFRLFANPQHGCGPRTFVATDLATGSHAQPFILAEIC